jgi:protein-disulfide isomerase-like protein with CxxC motif
MTDPLVTVTEYTDPVCSWAWGTEPKLRLLRWRHGHRTRWRRVMGGLVDDATSRRDDWDPVRAAEPMEAYWKQVAGFTGQPYPKPMHRMLRSTNPVGRGVHAAARQGDDVAERVLRRFRETIFVFGIGPDSTDAMAEAIDGVAGLDLDQWRGDVASAEVDAAYRQDWEETRRPNDFVRSLDGDRPGIGSMKHSEGHDRYAFPTLVFAGAGGETTVPGWMPFDAYVDAMEVAVPGSTTDARSDPTPREAFERWPLLTAKELEVLCGADATLPDGVVTHEWGDGVVHLTAAEASIRGVG